MTDKVGLVTVGFADGTAQQFIGPIGVLGFETTAGGTLLIRGVAARSKAVWAIAGGQWNLAIYDEVPPPKEATSGETDDSNSGVQSDNQAG